MKANIIPFMRYDDALAAIDWLCNAFGFERHLVVEEDGIVHHAQLRCGRGFIMLGSGHTDDLNLQTPRGCGASTAGVYIWVRDVNTHYARATAAGARIVVDIQDQDYGGRDYTACDPEGHLWSFGTYHPNSAA